jgi:hypothetical protein
MSSSSGPGALGPGAISITAEISDCRICSVRVVSSRPTNFTRLFTGRSASEVPNLAERLYSLCGFSHAVAATRAIATARGDTPTIHVARTESVGLLCERVSENLRSIAVSGAPGGDAFGFDLAAVPVLRRVFSLARELMVVAKSGPGSSLSSHATMRRLAQSILGGVKELGVSTPQASVDAPPGNSWFGNLWSESESDQSFAASVPDALEPDDDDAILCALRAESQFFPSRPSLWGRIPETGAFARHWREVDLSRGALLARLQARMIDLAQSVERLARAVVDELDGGSDVRCLSPATREGFASVETIRGRLHHWTRLTADDRVQDYAIVAPTEWNFHPAGPFVGAALGAKTKERSAQRSLARLASLFDPCVPARVEVLEPVDA